MIINHNPKNGYWSEESVTHRYYKLRSQLGGAEGFKLIPNTHTNKGGLTWIYHIMEAAVEGIKLGDNACIELSVEFIEANTMDSTTGYIRERIARNLRNADLKKGQKERLTKVFMEQLQSGNIYKEFKEYIRLFKRIGIETYRKNLEQLSESRKDYIQRAAQRLLD